MDDIHSRGEVKSQQEDRVGVPIRCHDLAGVRWKRQGTAIDRAMVAAQRRVILRHRRLGIPLVPWRDGRVVEVNPHTFDLPRGATMLEFKRGDLLGEDAEALVNPVNCDGYMGRGVAMSFKHWRERSRIDDIETGLGRLPWPEVRARIEAALCDLPDVRVIVFEPLEGPVVA